MIFGIQIHATFILKCSKMQNVLNHENCVMLMTFFPIFVILILIWFFFFLWKTQIDCLFLKDVITHETSSYLLQIALGTPLKCIFLFNHLTIFGWRQWSHLTFNQSTKILILGFSPFFLKTSIILHSKKT